MRNDRAYLEYISDNISLVHRFLAAEAEGPQLHLFKDDQLRQDAVLRRLETLSDAAAHLSDDLKARWPNISWHKITGFRNALAHGYFDVDLEVVWATIVGDLPELQEMIVQELAAGSSS